MTERDLTLADEVFDEDDEDDESWLCTHCNDDGNCIDPVCDPRFYGDPHLCHACGGSGDLRKHLR